MNKIVKVKGHACGYYSNAEYSEGFYVTEDFYEKYKDVLPTVFYVGELDGKHSETEGDISYYIFDIENDIKSIEEEYHNDGSVFYSIAENDNLTDETKNEFEKSLEDAKVILKSLDLYEDVTFKIKKSQIDKIQNLVEEYLKSENLDKH